MEKKTNCAHLFPAGAGTSPAIMMDLGLRLGASMNPRVFYSVQFSVHQFTKIAAGIGCAMPLFNVGDRVERIGVLGPKWMREGIITEVIPSIYSIHSGTEYEVDFEQFKVILYEVELRLINPSSPHD